MRDDYICNCHEKENDIVAPSHSLNFFQKFGYLIHIPNFNMT